MFRRFIALSSLALVWAIASNVITPATADAQTQAARMRFEAMDRNNDGAIARDEWQGSARSFQVHDWNGDGRLSGQEVAVGARRNSNWEEADHVPNRYERYVSWTASGFTNLDHNRDRRIATNEWHYDMETFRRVDRNGNGSLDQAEFLGADDYDDDRGDNFDDLDFNNNGRVEKTEWHGGAAAFNQLDRNRDGVLTRFEVAGGTEYANDTWDQFANLDYNRNGSVTRDEWHWSRAAFDSRDTNRDGILSRREFEVAGGAPVGTSGFGNANRARERAAAVDRRGCRRARGRRDHGGRQRFHSDERQRTGHGEPGWLEHRPASQRCADPQSARRCSDRAGG